MVRKGRRKRRVINVREDGGGGTSNEKIKSVTIRVSRKRNKLRKLKGMKKRQKGSRFRAGKVVKMKVKVTSDNEFRRRRN